MPGGDACPAGNVHFFAASSASRWKYLLGPLRLRAAADTAPFASTLTRTATLRCPRMVRAALRGTAGMTSCSASGGDASPFAGRIVWTPAAGGAAADAAEG